jgi:glycolate oxidase iron-sulfur subunit
MCGLCLPHCPTYRLAGNEAESPRGRIALAAGLIDGTIEADSAALSHLDHCLGCLSCQAVCPSQVRYDDILVATRARLDALRPPSRLRRALRDPRLLTRAARLAAWTQASRWLPKLATLFPARSPWRRLAQVEPAVPDPLRLRALPATPKRSRVALLRGCVATSTTATPCKPRDTCSKRSATKSSKPAANAAARWRGTPAMSQAPRAPPTKRARRWKPAARKSC